jgi:hypothetical protein
MPPFAPADHNLLLDAMLQIAAGDPGGGTGCLSPDAERVIDALLHQAEPPSDRVVTLSLADGGPDSLHAAGQAIVAAADGIGFTRLSRDASVGRQGCGRCCYLKSPELALTGQGHRDHLCRQLQHHVAGYVAEGLAREHRWRQEGIQLGTPRGNLPETFAWQARRQGFDRWSPQTDEGQAVRLARQIGQLDGDIGQDPDEERRKVAATIFRSEQAAEDILRKRWPEILDLAEMLPGCATGWPSRSTPSMTPWCRMSTCRSWRRHGGSATGCPASPRSASRRPAIPRWATC